MDFIITTLVSLITLYILVVTAVYLVQWYIKRTITSFVSKPIEALNTISKICKWIRK